MKTEEQKNAEQKPDKKPVPTSLIFTPEAIAKVRVLARGWDRTTSWTIRELVEGALASYFAELEEFATKQAIEDVEIAKIKGKTLTGETTAQFVKRSLAEEKQRNIATGKSAAGNS
jgi:hypothetical protein